MIPSYQEELRIRKNKDYIFWLIVAIMTTFLYFFFQGYYPNYEHFLDRTNTSKQAFLKPFGIIDIHVFPSPDSIIINNESYNNNSKTIFDLGEYMVFIQKKGYLPITFPLNISKKNPFYTNVVNLFTLPEYSPLPIVLNDISVSGDLFLLHTTGTGAFLLVDRDFRILHQIQTPYMPIGGLYFTDGNNILNYSPDIEKFLPVSNRITGLPLQCTDISYYNEKLFCSDLMKFVGPKTMDIREKILTINENIIVTPLYIYNGDVANTNWKYYEYATGSLQNPESLIHINKIPYILEKGMFFPLAVSQTNTIPTKKSPWWMETITQAREFNNETILIGEKEKKGMFSLISEEREYLWIFDFEQTKDVKISKINSAYVFTTSTAVYIYYKGAREIVKILDGVKILRIFDAQIFFNKEGKSYVLDLLRKEGK